MLTSNKIRTRFGIRLNSIFKPGYTHTYSEWVSVGGEDNVKLAMLNGVLSEEVDVNAPIPMDDVMEEGHYVVFKGDYYILYHACDGQLWRTEANTLDEISEDNAQTVDGILPEERDLPIIRTGQKHRPVPKKPDGVMKKLERKNATEIDEI